MFECVPNVSEGRDQPTIRRLIDAVRATQSRLLDTHTDADHHRTVFTVVGDAPAISDGAVALARCATAHIDLRCHTGGVHPRMGAVDVMPFVPLSPTTMAECVRVARTCGRRIAEALDIPVFLYGHAAVHDDRSALPVLRKGGFEGLEHKMRSPDWIPDYGPRSPHPTAGAMAVGARTFLVAYNVQLDTRELKFARRIASAIRETNGGLPGVRALGFPLHSKGCVQVSMNLTDVSETSIPGAFRVVLREAERLGVAVLSSEIVGLAPRAAFEGVSSDMLMLERATAYYMLENRLEDVT